LFGFVTVNSEILSGEDKARYKAVYCGLCHSLSRRHGLTGRLSLNYDMCFLVLTLGSLYEPDERGACLRCPRHPVAGCDAASSEFSDYAADMTVALSYLNMLDKWNDDRNPLGLIYARLLKKKFEAVCLSYPRQCRAMTDAIDGLSALERASSTEPDRGALLFGQLMAEVFILNEDRWSESLRKMGLSLGRFIYIMDAVVDLPRDMKKGRYNPLSSLYRSGKGEEFFRDLLSVLIGECSMEFEKLPLVQDVSILRNILYSGVWTRYEFERQRAKVMKEKHAND
jgi:hypothetical protein